MSEATLPRCNSYVGPEHVPCRRRVRSGGAGIQRCSNDLPPLGLFRERSRAENAARVFSQRWGDIEVKRFSALDRLGESIRTAGQMSTESYTKMTKITRMTKMRYRLRGIYLGRGVARPGRIRGGIFCLTHGLKITNISNCLPPHRNIASPR
jgi:hypothetical protein